MIRELLPGIVLPGLIYFVASRSLPTIEALACASSVPALDSAWRVLRGRPPSIVGLVFVAVTGVSVGLAMWFKSPVLMLYKGAVVSGLMGIAFALSALIRRPLTRTLAIRLSSDQAEGRRKLTELWHHPVALRVFCALSVGWGLLLVVSGMQQAALAFTISPGLFVTVEPPMQATATLVGIGVSVLYVRRLHRLYPDLHLLPARAG